MLAGSYARSIIRARANKLPMQEENGSPSAFFSRNNSQPRADELVQSDDLHILMPFYLRMMSFLSGLWLASSIV
jgi:hypothetical protein